MTHLTTSERYQIAHDLRLNMPTKLIAQALGRSVRTIQRELASNGGRDGYHAEQACLKRRQRATKSACNHPTIEDAVWDKVLDRVKCKLSPDQAICSEGLKISISAVYRHLHRTGKIKIQRHLRRYRCKPRRGKTGWVKQAKSIKQRSVDVKTRDCVGHMETDSIVGKRNEHDKILVTIDRATRYVRLGLVRDGSSKTVATHFERWIEDLRLPILTITTDQGSEFAGLPAIFTDNLYACDPGKPYQKGAIENMNGLIRQYIPKGKSLRRVTQAQLNDIAKELNDRPRKRLGYKTPAQLLLEVTTARQFER
jgi:IS30 family transposase